MTKTDQLTMSASRQALMALGVIGVAGYLVSSTMGTLLDNNIGGFDSTLEAAPASIGTRSESIGALMEFADTSNTPIEFVNTQDATVVEFARDSQRLLSPEIEEFANHASQTSYTVTGVGFAARSDRIETEQLRMLDQLERQAIGQSEQARNVLAAAGISLDNIARATIADAEVPATLVSYTQNSDDEQFSDRVAQVSGRIAENRRLMEILMSAPLAAPLDRTARRTSGFGTRHDPFTGDTRFHAGVDMSAPMNSNVQVTATGTVIFAGWKDGYGNCIDIDHGNGFTTRYGHLNRVDVSVGQRVNVGHNIGLLGSTGRSTGPHLHYEVWYRGQIMDPRNFMTAGDQIHSRT